MAFKPDGYHSVSPYLIFNGAQATINFLVADAGGTTWWVSQTLG